MVRARLSLLPLLAFLLFVSACGGSGGGLAGLPSVGRVRVMMEGEGGAPITQFGASISLSQSATGAENGADATVLQGNMLRLAGEPFTPTSLLLGFDQPTGMDPVFLSLPPGRRVVGWMRLFAQDEAGEELADLVFFGPGVELLVPLTPDTSPGQMLEVGEVRSGRVHLAGIVAVVEDGQPFPLARFVVGNPGTFVVLAPSAP